jgi:regulator of nucleoside diphosphate kinase
MSKTQVRLPSITLTAHDADRLDRLATAANDKLPRTAHFLAREVARANIVEASGIESAFVSMGSTVEYRDDTTGQTRIVTLVYPNEANLALGCISVLSPVGAALIGLSAGQSIEWRTPTGGKRSLTVLRVAGAAAGGRMGPVANPAGA